MSEYLIKISLGTVENPIIKQILQEATEWLAHMVYAYLVEKANTELHSRRSLFLQAIKVVRTSDGTFGVKLDNSAKWIVEGSEPFNMLDGLLGSPKAKISKDGNRYITVPFSHNQRSGMTPMQAILSKAVKAEMRARDIGMEKEDESSQSAEYGELIDNFDIDQPATKEDAYYAAGQAPPWGVEKKQYDPVSPLLKGVRVYSSEASIGTHQPKGRAYTFRVASEKQRGTGAWDHPGTPPSSIWQDAQEFANDKWENVILPDAMSDIIGREDLF